MRKVAFYLENQRIPEVNLSRPELGNPGCGGTEYLFVALPYFLKLLQLKKCQPILLANHTANLPEGIPNYKVKDVSEAARVAKELDCSMFVYRPRRALEVELINLIDELKLPSIAWFHITPVADHLRALAKSTYVKATVCVEREQHDLAKDTAVWNKLTCIVNGFHLEGYQLPNPPEKDPNMVVYIGALVRQKGFHLLAKAWPEVRARNPKAKLMVIGTGALYDNKAALGPWGIAEESYERQYIIPYLQGDDGKPMPSVNFLGKLGEEKKQFLYQAILGVPNPTGQTENCPGSALEVQASGTAAVSGAYYGMLDTIRDGETGILGLTKNDLVNNICSLLEDTDRARELGKNGIKFIEQRYGFDHVTREWCDLFEAIENGKKPKVIPFKNNLLKHSKIFILLNRYLQIILGSFIPWPSVIEIKGIIFKFLQLRKFK